MGESCSLFAHASKSIQKLPAENGIAHIPQGRGILGTLSVKENLIMGAYPKKYRKTMNEEIERAYNRFPKLRERQNQLAGSLSGGEQQMLAIARALMIHPKLLMLDEPSLGLAPIVVENMFEIISNVSREEKVSILIVEQNLMQALTISSAVPDSCRRLPPRRQCLRGVF